MKNLNSYENCLDTGAHFTPQSCDVFSLGSTDHGTSVLHMVRAFEQASGKRIPMQIGPRSLATFQCWADPSKAQQVLEWRANRGLTRDVSECLGIFN